MVIPNITEGQTMAETIRVVALVCTLTPSPEPSSSDLIARQVLAELSNHRVEGELVRVVDHDVHVGVQTDMGNGDGWPEIRKKILQADIVLIATPIWLGHPASIAQKV